MLLVAAAAVVEGATTGFEAASRGSYLQDGSSNGSAAGNNYVVGDCNRIDPKCPAGGPGPAEWRNWFRFDLSSASGPVTAATLLLQIPTDDGFVNTRSATATYTLFDIAPGDLAGLGAASVAIWADLRARRSYRSYVASRSGLQRGRPSSSPSMPPRSRLSMPVSGHHLLWAVPSPLLLAATKFNFCSGVLPLARTTPRFS